MKKEKFLKKGENQKGFTLIELLAIISLISIIVLIALPSILKLYQDSRKDVFLKNIAAFKKQAELKIMKGASGAFTTGMLEIKNDNFEYDIRIVNYEVRIYDFRHKAGKGSWMVDVERCEIGYCVLSDIINDRSYVVLINSLTGPAIATNQEDCNRPSNTVTITYDASATSKSYKIDDGNWQEYTGPITINNSSTIYAKSIVGGKETKTMSKNVYLNDVDWIPICTQNDLISVKNELNRQYILINDINLIGTWTPIPGQFGGKFNGNQKTISNLTIDNNTASYQGLFVVLNEAEIKDLTINANIVGKNNIGILAGDSDKSIITNVSTNGSVTGAQNVGGLIGTAFGDKNKITSSSSSAYVNGTGDSVGGLIGYSSKSEIKNSYATGEVKGEGYSSGGLIGYADGNTITSSYTTSDITGGSDSVGGLIGYAYKNNITSSHATGTIKGEGYSAGGLIGYADENIITSSYSSGNIIGSDSVGGLVGYAYKNNITSSYSTGAITGNAFSSGGLIGHAIENTITTAYSVGNIIGTADSTGGLIGYASKNEITFSHSTGNISGTGDSVGGLIGYDSLSKITSSYATGLVLGKNDVGGIIGYSDESIINKSYFSGGATGLNSVGGIIGFSYYSSISSSYVSGVLTDGSSIGGITGVSSSGSTIKDTIFRGGLTKCINGENTCYGITNGGVVTNSFYDSVTTASLPVMAGGGIAKTTSELKMKSTYENANFDLINIWSMTEGNFPVLKDVGGQ